MKEFPSNFFEEAIFIKSKIDYNFLDLKPGEQAYHVAYNVNDGFIHIMGASVVSVLETNKEQPFVFHLFTDGYSEENSKKIEQLAKDWGCRCILYHLDMKPFEDFHIKVARFSRITYGRIYMPKVLKKYTDHCIYLDADTMCCGSLRELWELDMNGAAMGAVSEHPEAVTYRVGYLNLKNGKYFNDGIMLIDINQWEKQEITKKAFSYQNEPPKRFLGQSQDVLNLVFDGTNYFLPSKYNRSGGDPEGQADTVITHWTGRRKPWQMVVTERDAQWRMYNEKSPWETITNILPIKKPENYHDFQQWGRYQKSLGHYGKYLQGMFWYAALRTVYKLGGNKKN